MRCRIKTILNLIFFLWAGYFTAGGQTTEYSYINYDTKDGLAGSNVYSITQDQDGFLWLATDNGLSRFDGKNFRNFTVQDGLPDNEILKVFTDSKNRVWILPFGNAICYYFRGKIYNRTNSPLLSGIEFNGNPYQVAEDRRGNIIIHETAGYYILQTDGSMKTVAEINGKPIMSGPVGLDKEGEFICLINFWDYFKAYAGFIHPLKLSQKGEKTYTPILNREKIVLHPDCMIFSENNEDNHLSFNGDIRLLGDLTQYTGIDYLPAKRMLALYAGKGVNLFDLTTNKKTGSILSAFGINATFIDKDGNYWFASRGKGLFFLPSFSFKNLVLQKDNESYGVYSLIKHGDQMLIGSDNNKVWRFNTKSGDLSSATVRFPRPEPGRVLAIRPLDTDIIAYGGDGGIILSNAAAAAQQLIKPSFEPIEDKKTSVKSFSLKNNKLLYATAVTTRVYSLREKVMSTIWPKRATSAVEADSGFYIGTLNGLVFLGNNGDSILYGLRYPALNGRIAQLLSTDDGTVWVSTKGNGVMALEKGKLVAALTTQNGLTSNNCTALFAEPGGNTIWLGTDKGINRIVRTDTGFVVKENYTLSDGLLSDIVQAITVADSMVYIGSPKGLTFFRPDSVALNSTCRLSLTGIFVKDKYWAYDSSGFSLPHKNNDIRFNFAGISFKSGGEIIYHYRLKGLHDDWRITQENQLAFPTLPSGSYTLELKAVNKYGVESGVKAISFAIEKLWWEKTGYRLLMLGALLLAVWAFIRLRLRYIRERQKKADELNRHIAELEQTALRAQMNPHFIFNSLNSIQQYVADRDITGANQFITDFSKLIRMTLDLSGQSLITLSEELLYIDTYLRLERARLENQFDYEFSIDPEINTRDFQLPPLILQPFVENSIRHGIKYLPEKNGMIRIKVIRLPGRIRISIEDNGIGRQASQQYKTAYHVQYQSKGMSISSGRIDLMNKTAAKKIQIEVLDLHNLSGAAAGTAVNIEIPDAKKET